MRPISPPRNGPGRTIAPAGRGSDTLPGAKRLFLPMRTGRGAIGVVGIDSDKPGPLLTPDQRRLLDALDRPGGARHRARPPRRGHGPGQAHGRDGPAALGAADLDLARPQDAARRGPRGGRHAARSVGRARRARRRPSCSPPSSTKSERLNRFIANLLDMTKLESGAVVPNAALHDLGEIVGSALRRAGKILAQHRVEVELAADLPMVRARSGAVRAGPVQPPRQCGQICAGRHDHPHPELARPATRSACRSWTRATAFRPAIWSTSSTSSIGRRRAIRCAPAPGLGLRSPAASSRPCTARSPRRTAPTGRAPCSRSGCRSRPRSQAAGHRRMSAAPLKVLVIDDEPPIRKLLRMGLTTQGYRDSRGAERQDRARAAGARSRTWSFSISACPTFRGTSCCG